MNKIFFTKKAEKDFIKLAKPIKSNIIKYIDLLENNNFHQLDMKKLNTPFEGYRLRISNYRILFTRNKQDITVYSIKHRKEAYKLK